MSVETKQHRLPALVDQRRRGFLHPSVAAVGRHSKCRRLGGNLHQGLHPTQQQEHHTDHPKNYMSEPNKMASLLSFTQPQSLTLK
jgi:hypothetical protein